MLNNIFKFLFLLFLRLPESPLKKAAREIFYGEVVTERIIEYPLVFSFLDYRGARENRKVLDIGCYYSNLPIQLASMGFNVTGVDLQDYQLTHPNFIFKKGDIRKIKLSGKFDIVTAISTIEHIGLDFYKEGEKEEGDIEVVKAINKLLRPKGIFILSIPFGRKGKTDSYRSYDWESIINLLKGFKIKKALFFKDTRTKWGLVEKNQALTVDNVTKVKGAGFFVAEKK